VTVWMVHLDRTGVHNDVKGTLALDGEALAFTPSSGSRPTGFAFASISMAKRLRGSPVLLIEWQHETAPRRTAFYFTEPPPLPGRAGRDEPPSWDTMPERPNPLKAFRNGKRRNMRVNTRYLQDVAISKKELIKLWADEVAGRIGGGS